MYPYFFVILLSVIISSYIKESFQPFAKYGIELKIYNKRTFAKIMCILPSFFLSAFRYGVGTDYWPTYHDGFIRVMNGSNYDHFDIGYRGLNLLLSRITTDPQIIFVVTSFLFSVFTFCAIYNLSVDIPFSIYLLFVTRYFFISLNVVRQFVALGIVLYALKYLFKGMYKKYVAFVIIAMMFHYMVGIAIIFIFFIKWKLDNDKTIILMIAMAGLFVLSRLHIIENIVQVILRETRYAHHFTNQGLFTGEKFALFTFALNLSLFFLYYSHKKANDPKYNLFLNSQMIATILCALMTSVHLIERVYYIFGFIQILSIPYMVKLQKNRENQIFLKLAICTFFSAYCFWDIFLKCNHEVVPYTSIWK